MTSYDTFNLLKKYITEGSILKYANPEKPHTLFTDARKYAWTLCTYSGLSQCNCWKGKDNPSCHDLPE